MDRFTKIVHNYFHKTLHIRCLKGLELRFYSGFHLPWYNSLCQNYWSQKFYSTSQNNKTSRLVCQICSKLTMHGSRCVVFLLFVEWLLLFGYIYVVDFKLKLPCRCVYPFQICLLDDIESKSNYKMDMKHF